MITNMCSVIAYHKIMFLLFGRMDRLEWPLNNGKRFSKNRQPTKEMELYKFRTSFHLFLLAGRLEMGEMKKWYRISQPE